MKKIFFIISFISLSCFLFSNDSNNKMKMIGVIKSKDGMNLRDGAGTSSKKIGYIPYHSQVTILDVEGPEEILYGIKSQWCKIEYAEKTGWIFGGFIDIDNINNIDDEKNSYMHYAIDNNNFNIIKFLINKGADINLVNNNSETPLLFLFKKYYIINGASSFAKNTNKSDDFYQLTKMFIQKGAEINLYGSQGFTPLNFSSYYSDINITNLLLDSKADPNIKTRSSDSSLFLVSSQFSVEILENLVKHGADINSICSDGNTALHHAVASGSIQAVKKLLDLGADINIINKNGNKPLHLLAFRDDDKFELIQYFINKGADINEKNHDGFSPLHLAAESCKYKNVKELIRLKANINIQDNLGRTPLHLTAPIFGCMRVLSFLVVNGADVNIKDNKGNRAIDYAIEDHKEYLKKYKK